MKKVWANDKYIFEDKPFVDVSKMEVQKKVRKKARHKLPKRMKLTFMTEIEAKEFWERRPLLSKWEEAILALWYGWREPVGEWEENLLKEIKIAKKKKAPLEFYGEVF